MTSLHKYQITNHVPSYAAERHRSPHPNTYANLNAFFFFLALFPPSSLFNSHLRFTFEFYHVRDGLYSDKKVIEYTFNFLNEEQLDRGDSN